MSRKSFIGMALLATVLLLAGCESMDWQHARKRDTVASYQEFISQHPNGKFRESAEKKIDALVFDRARKQGTYQAFEQYLDQFPRGEHADEVKTVIRSMLKGHLQSLTVPEMMAVRLTFSTTQGSFTIKLRPDKAPMACRNLLSLAASHFYVGLFVNQVDPNRLVLMGDPRGTGRGGPGYFMAAEINDLPFNRGAVAMRSLPDDLNTVGSQLYVALTSLPEMQGHHTICAEVTEGIEVLDKISQAPASGPRQRFPGRPLEPITIMAVSIEGIDLFGSDQASPPPLEERGIAPDEETRILNGETGDEMEEPQ